MKDTTGKIITEEEFTKDIGHGVEGWPNIHPLLHPHIDNHMFSHDQIREINEMLEKAREKGSKEEREKLAVEVDKKLREILAKELPILQEKTITQYKKELVEKINKLYQDTNPVEIINDERVPVETYGYEETHNNALSEVKKLL
jgi:E3 ubiquitin-protein ligase DOA10